MKLTIDGIALEAHDGETVLECALRHGIRIPNLCTHPILPPYGACRMCVVKIEGMRGYPSSCSTPAAEGMAVEATSAELTDLRRRILQLMLLEHPSACMVCDKRDLCDVERPAPEKAGRTTGCHTCNNSEECEIRVLSQDLEIDSFPVPPFYRQLPIQRSDPFIDRDLNLCILCGRCVRICKHNHERGTIDVMRRGSSSYIGTAFNRSLVEAGCTFCGSCVDVCPTGSLADRYAKWVGGRCQSTETSCAYCEAACALKIWTTGAGRIVEVEAVNPGVPICLLGRFGLPEFHGGAKRLRVPQVRVGEVLREVSFEDALRHAAERLEAFKGEAFAAVCDTTTTLEDRLVLKCFTGEVMGSSRFVEIEPDARGVSRAGLDPDVRAAVVTGDFLESVYLERLDLLIVIDCYPTPASQRADVLFPVAVFAELEGTRLDGHGRMRPLRRAARPPGEARPERRIVAELARRMGASGFEEDDLSRLTEQVGAARAQLRIDREKAPLAAHDPRRRRTHFRGHRLDRFVGGLRYVPLGEVTSLGCGSVRDAAISVAPGEVSDGAPTSDGG